MRQLDHILELTAESRELARDDPVTLYNTLQTEVAVYERRGDFENAIRALNETLAASISAFGEDAAATVELHEQLLQLLLVAGRYEEALPHAELMVGVMATRHGVESTETADALARCGRALDQLGRYAEAASLYRQALRTLRRERGECHRSVLVLRFNLAELARVQGDHTIAARHFRDLEALDAVVNPEPAARDAQLLVNLGLTLISMDRLEEARQKLNQALSLREKSDGMRSPLYGRVLMALGQLEQRQNNHRVAARLFEDAAGVLDGPVAWKKWREGALFEASLCRIHLGDPQGGTREAKGWIAHAATELGQYHPEIMLKWHNLILQLVLAGVRDGLAGMIEEADNCAQCSLVETLKSQPASTLGDTVDQYRQWQRLYVSLLMAEPSPSLESRVRAYDMLARLSGTETTVLRLRGRRLLQNDASELRRRILRLNRNIERVNLQEGRGDSSARLTSDLRRYQHELEDAEISLALQTDPTWIERESSVMSSRLPALLRNTVTVAFTTFVQLEGGALGFGSGTAHYAAFVRSEGSGSMVQVIDLGPTSTIDELIERYREGVIAQGRIATPDEDAWRIPGLELMRRLIDPLRSALDSSSHQTPSTTVSA